MHILRASCSDAVTDLMPALRLGAGSLLAALFLSLRPAAEGPVAVLFPPWWDTARAVAAAGAAGPVVRPGAFPFVVVVAPEVADAGRALRAAGAWLLLDPGALGGCLRI